MQAFQKIVWFACGMLIGLTALSITKAAMPINNRVTDDTAIYQKLSEIRTKKEVKPDFDADISQLAQLENRYREKLPALVVSNTNVRGPVKQVSHQRYQQKPQQRYQKPQQRYRYTGIRNKSSGRH